MSSNASGNKSVFKYNMSFYYQSTIIYFIVFVLYLLIRGEFVENEFTLITRDPVLYFLAIIVTISVLSIFYNLFKSKQIEIDDESIAFIDRFRERRFKKSNIVFVKFFRQKRSIERKRFRIVRIKIEGRRRPIMFRISDYENEEELYNKILELKSAVESR
ncbi:hypothetical protein BMS3Abin03_00243 [bacterium BMS3Abin03]|nr:hypothetical protein BMS3Abin03_00243 [bacterium BMS3Abin03]HDZ58472.1 hypothetical protein [Ignavibacteriales bacterium]